MNTQAILDPERWAKQTFGPSQLKDIRRTRRAVQTATRMAQNTSASLPAQLQTWKDVIALYRLLDEADVTFEALMQPHWHQTREQIETRSVVWLVQDTTEVDLSHHPKTKGLGQVGNERGRGLYLQTVLAILPESGAVVGCALQEPWVRIPAPAGETRSERGQRSQRETDVWMRLVSRLGRFPAETRVVQVGDRGADLFPFFQACQATQTQFLIRAFENRRIGPEERPAQEILDADLLAVVAAQVGQPPRLMTAGAFWKAVAQMGGYLARQGDGPPGWKTLWHGWLHVQTLLEGVHLAFQLRL